MKYFIGIVPPKQETKRIDQFRLRWENNQLPKVVEPHVTLKAQGGLTEDKKWIEPICQVCERFHSFQLAFNKPQFFFDNILYLSVLSEEIYLLHQQIVRAVSPPDESIKQFFELDAYVPHLTLGKSMSGLTKEELIQMSNCSEEELLPIPSFLVNFIRVYQ